MKNIAVIFFLCIINLINAQKTIKQLNNTIGETSSNQNIELRTYNNANKIQKANKQTVNKMGLYESIKSKNKEKKTVVKYDGQIKLLPKIAISSYKKLDPNLDIKNVRVIPEYYIDYLERPTEDSEPLIYIPVISISNLLVNDEDKGYRTKIKLQLHSDDPKKYEKEDGKISVKLEILSEKLQVKNSKITLSHLNLPTTDIELYTDKKNLKDSVEIRIITDSNPVEGYAFYLKVNPSLSLISNQKKIQGFGVQKAEVLVRFYGSNSKKQEKVVVRSSSGEVSPSSFTLGYTETKKINVRSEGIDDIKLTASTSSAELSIEDSNTVIIKQTFPYLFLLASLLGGILGMVIKYGYIKDKKISPKLFIAGVLIGLLGAIIYYVLGINFLRIEVPSTFNEFAVLAFSALCSLLLKPNLFNKINPSLTK